MTSKIIIITRTIVVEKRLANYIEKALNCKRKNMLGEDEAIVKTAIFPDGIEMDIRCCGVQYNKDDDNSAWTEAVLYHNGEEVACSEVNCSFFGKWELEYNGTLYRTNVIRH